MKKTYEINLKLSNQEAITLFQTISGIFAGYNFTNKNVEKPKSPLIKIAEKVNRQLINQLPLEELEYAISTTDKLIEVMEEKAFVKLRQNFDKTVKSLGRSLAAKANRNK